MNLNEFVDCRVVAQRRGSTEILSGWVFETHAPFLIIAPNGPWVLEGDPDMLVSIGFRRGTARFIVKMASAREDEIRLEIVSNIGVTDSAVESRTKFAGTGKLSAGKQEVVINVVDVSQSGLGIEVPPQTKKPFLVTEGAQVHVTLNAAGELALPATVVYARASNEDGSQRLGLKIGEIDRLTLARWQSYVQDGQKVLERERLIWGADAA